MALKNKLKRNLQYIVFTAVFSAWLVSLLAVYLPVSNWVTPTFPSTVDNNALMIFLVTTALSSLSSLFVGLNMLGINSRLKMKVQGTNQALWFKNLRTRWNSFTGRLSKAKKRMKDSWTSFAKIELKKIGLRRKGSS